MIKILGSAHPKYLAATDILIGDMSNVNYEFLIYNRPIVLLANKWLMKVFPDIGIKADLNDIESAIERSLDQPAKFARAREKWLENTISCLDRSASHNHIEIIRNKSGISDPSFYFLSGGNTVRESNIVPLYEAALDLKYKSQLVTNNNRIKGNCCDNSVFVAAHFIDLLKIKGGYKVHIDHDLKGIGTANLRFAQWDYHRNNYFPNIDLHIAAGKAGEARTKLVLGPNNNRVVVGVYPKADHFKRFDTQNNKDYVYNELGFTNDKPMITYAPAGEESFMKPGGSYNKAVLDELFRLSEKYKNIYHILVKMKYNSSISGAIKSKIKQLPLVRNKIVDDGTKWLSLYHEDDIVYK